ncbi:MAG: bifunctional phosphopantothenoylcysteine decarboxylase/phosphopantothenate--cysteine ligase CoaBC, partial [Wenzhouxiangella sp.]
MSRSSPRILVLVSGSIAAYKALDLLSRLNKWGAELRVVLSAGAERFVTPLSVEALTGRAPYQSQFAAGQAMAHIRLAEWADLVVLYPASASTLNRLAAGLADDLIGSLSLARDTNTPFWLAPAMNPRMWAHPAVQGSTERLDQWGYRVLAPAAGLMACGDEGVGRLIEPGEVFEQIQRHFEPAASAPVLRWLITAGGTREPVDAVRYLGNYSSGRTGAELARYFLDQGDEVTLLSARHALVPEPRERLTLNRYSSVAELEAGLRQALQTKTFDAVVHAAAVSDYRVVDAQPDLKLDSAAAERTLRLERTPKLLDQIRRWADDDALYLVGFKLLVASTPATVAEAVARQHGAARPDLVVVNELGDVDDQRHLGEIWKDGQRAGRFQDR